MRTAARLFGVAGALALIAGLSAAQNANDMTINNDGDILFILSDPSSGGTNGDNPPAIADGDYFWKVYPREALHCKEGTIKWEMMWETYVKTDWSTTGDFYDRTITSAYECGDVDNDGDLAPDCLPACAQVPSWLATGGFVTGDLLIIIGEGGLPNPCSVAPSLCTSPGGACAGTPGGPPSGLVGFTVQWTFTNGGFAIPCDASAPSYEALVPTVLGPTIAPARDTAVTYFAPGGMIFCSTTTPGTCGLGDYIFQMDYSTNETQGDCCGEGFSPYGGFAIAGAAFLDPLNFGSKAHLGFDTDIINVVNDTGFGALLEVGDNGGGALNGLCLDTSSGLAKMSIELRDYLSGLNPGNLAFTAFSLGPIPAPGISIFGGNLMVIPDPILAGTLSSGTVAQDLTIGIAGAPGTPEARYNSPQIPLPSFGLIPGNYFTFYAQGFVLTLGAPITAEETQVWELQITG